MNIVLLIDASGSMCSYQEETRNSIYSIIKELNKKDFLYLVYFDTNEYKIVAQDYAGRISAKSVSEQYIARGGTPITDSVYKAILDSSNKFSNVSDLNNPHKFIIFTDGEENSSRLVTPDKLGQAIEHFSENFGWNFEFIGPKNIARSLQDYTNSIKIRPENVSLYSDISEGLSVMRDKILV